MSAPYAESGIDPEPGRGLRHLWTKVALGALLIGSVAGLGRDFAHHLPTLEDWIASQGTRGYVVFIAAVVVCTSLFVPDTVFAIMGGVLFGVLGGTIAVVVASLLTAAVDFAISRQFLRVRVSQWLKANPRLAAIERAVKREGLRFQFMLRLTPINPATLSYVLGATHTRFSTFLAASLGLIPGLFVEVYFGYVTKHLAKVAGKVGEYSAVHTPLIVAGLAACVTVLLFVTRLVRRALAGYENPLAEAAS